MPSELDDSAFPLVRIRSMGMSSDADVEERLAFLDRQLARGERVALLIDAQGARPISARQRRMWVEWLHDNEDAIERFCVCAAFVIDSVAVRGVYSAIFWMFPLPIEYDFLESPDVAVSWARGRLDRATSTH